MVRWSFVLTCLGLSIIGIAGCDGVLREKVGGEVDAGVLDEIPSPTCSDVVAPIGDGHHNPGEDCLSCHHQGGMDGAPPFTFAGTMYEDSGGTTPLAGGSFHLIDAIGNDVLVQTEANGNFYSYELLQFPVVAFRATCPDVHRMLAPIHDTDGSCNASGCHTAGFRLH